MSPEARRDLQGLRGVGVILVVVGHLFLAPQGVFSALDIFFVLSGYLITGLLLEAAESHGRIYFVPFYLARARRILPMGVFVITVTTVVSYVFFSSARGKLVGVDGVWALVFAANWHYSSLGTNYFQDTAQSPFLHYWSLSVEEQFYAVWPFLLFIVLALATARGWRSRRAVAILVGAMTVGTFTYSCWHSVTAPNAAYFSTFDRA